MPVSSLNLCSLRHLSEQQPVSIDQEFKWSISCNERLEHFSKHRDENGGKTAIDLVVRAQLGGFGARYRGLTDSTVRLLSSGDKFDFAAHEVNTFLHSVLVQLRVRKQSKQFQSWQYHCLKHSINHLAAMTTLT